MKLSAETGREACSPSPCDPSGGNFQMMLTQNIAEMQSITAEHIAADAVRQGVYWQDGKGCFIGCLVHSENGGAVAEKFGMPMPLVRICENIFERLPASECADFFREVPDAIGADGRDLSRVHWAFLADTLRHLPKVSGDAQAVVDVVIVGMDLLSDGKVWAYAAARAAARAADASYAAGVGGIEETQRQRRTVLKLIREAE